MTTTSSRKLCSAAGHRRHVEGPGGHGVVDDDHLGQSSESGGTATTSAGYHHAVHLTCHTGCSAMGR